MWTPGSDGGRTGRGVAGKSRSYRLIQDSGIESLCARTVQAIGDRNACVTTETERRNPQTHLARCAHAYGGGGDAHRRCPRVFTGNSNMLHRRRFCTSKTSRPGCLFLGVHVCVVQDNKKTKFTPELLSNSKQKKKKPTNHLLCFHKYLFTFLLNKINHMIKNDAFNKKKIFKQ